MNRLLLPLVLAACCTALTVHAQSKNFHDQDLSEKSFKGTNLNGADFSDAILRHCDFTDASAKNAIFKGADLTTVILNHGDFTGADFRQTVFGPIGAEKVKFNNANFEGLDIKGANVYQDNFRGANLKNTKGWALVTWCDFSGAHLEGANMRGIHWAGGDQVKPRFRGATYNDDTTFPDNFDPKAEGLTLSKSSSDEAKDSDKKDE